MFTRTWFSSFFMSTFGRLMIFVCVKPKRGESRQLTPSFIKKWWLNEIRLIVGLSGCPVEGDIICRFSVGQFHGQIFDIKSSNTHTKRESKHKYTQKTMSVCRTVCVCVPCLNCSIGLCWVPKHSFSYVCMCIVSIIQTRIIICSFIFFPERSGIWCVLYLYLTLTLFRPNMTSFKTINDPNKLVRMSLIIHVCGINFMFGTFFYLVFSAIRVRIFGTGTNGTRTGHINAGIPLNRFEPIYCCCCCCSCV